MQVKSLQQGNPATAKLAQPILLVLTLQLQLLEVLVA
jgi:hypothetical protein